MKPCLNCDDTGWVCENHPKRPWDGCSNRRDACGCGPGAPCEDCNGDGQDHSRAIATVIHDLSGSKLH